MTAKGLHERLQSPEIARVFAVSAVRLDAAGAAVEVLWGEINEKSNGDVGAPARALASEVITAIHAGHQVVAIFPKTHGTRPDQAFIVREQKDGSEVLALDGKESIDHDLGNLTALQPL